MERSQGEDVQVSYSNRLSQYVRLTERLRRLEARGAEFSTKVKLDERRSKLHRILEGLGERLGKTSAEVYADFLLEMGNLREYGIEAPLVKLPLPSVVFRYDENLNKVLFDQKKWAVRQVLANTSDKPLLTGEELMQRWASEPFYAIIFSRYIWDHGTTLAPEDHKSRMRVRKNLARDFKLKLFSADDMMGHYFVTPSFTYGVEVPLARVEEVAVAMAKNRDRYWIPSK